jgi:hypothetical protein
VSQPESWSADAFNPVPESENRIHSDEVARAYGFRGGLVPGVVVSAYLLHPGAVAWGRDFAERGQAHVRVGSPVYDGESFRVEVEDAQADRYDARLSDDRGVECATAQVSLPDRATEPPVRRGDRLLPRDAERPVVSRALMERLRETGLAALRARWSEQAEITRYLRDPAGIAPVYAQQGLASPSFILALTNWVLAANVQMSPWLHLETDSQFFHPIEPGVGLVVEAAIADLFEKKGHEFVDVDVAVFGSDDDAARAAVRLRAIYQLRPSQAPEEIRPAR